jgi:hypothetical protein
MKTLKRFCKLSFRNKRLTLHILGLLGFYRMQVLALPFKKWVHPVGVIGLQAEPNVVTQNHALLRQLRVGIPLIAQRTPWRSNCLAQALTAAHILRQKHIAYTLYLGVNTMKPQTLSAHAWIQVGNLILTGNDHLSQYKVATTIGYQPNIRGQHD